MIRRFKDILKVLKKPSSDKEGSIRETIGELIEDETQEQSELTEHEKKLLSNVLSMQELTVEDVAIPRADMVSCSIQDSFQHILDTYSKTGFSKLPIYGETLDDVLGYLNVQDLLKFAPEFKETDITPLIREVLFVPESMQLMDLLLQMRATKAPVAIVVDEYGGVDGLVTLWDVVQELIGETDDSDSQDTTKNTTKMSDGSVIANARMELEDFEDEFGPFLTKEEREEEENDTIGGLITSLIGRVPTRKEIITHPSGIEFEILEADPRRIIRVRVHFKNKKEDVSVDAS
ncbi:MAG: HlyC/CorC family transporter [Alphaproteobacteria bacterium]|nr:HlyC/CorC family transporter [Alphaproteobacteria bacterium]